MGYRLSGTQFLQKGGGSVFTTTPYSVLVWVYISSLSIGAAARLVMISNSPVGSEFHGLYAWGESTTIGWTIQHANSGGNRTAAISKPRASSVGHWVPVIGIFTSDSSRTIYVYDGGSATNTESSGALDVDYLSYGAFWQNSAIQLLNGAVSMGGIWDVALTVAEVSVLLRGYHPVFVRPQSLVGCYPMIGGELIDIIGGNDLTTVNAPAKSENDPPYIYPSYPQVGLTISAAVAGAIMPQFQYANLGASLYNGTLIG